MTPGRTHRGAGLPAAAGRHWLPGCLLAGLLICLPACHTEPDPAAPLTATGVVQGRLSRIGSARLDYVEFQTVGTEGNELTVQVQADERGHYVAELPAGDYTVRATVGEHSVILAGGTASDDSFDAPDTIRVGPATSPLTIDFPLGAVNLAGERPARLESVRTALAVYHVPVAGGSARRANETSLSQSDGPLALTVAGLVPGDYVAEFRWAPASGSMGERFWLPATREVTAALVFRVAADSLTGLVAALPEPAVLTGRVAGAWLAMGQAQPSLTLVDAQGGTVAGAFAAQADGSFTLPLFAPAPCRVMVDCSGIQQWAGGRSADEATVFTPMPGETLALTIEGGGLRLRTFVPDELGSERQARFSFYVPGAASPAFSVERPLRHLIDFANLAPGDWLVRVAPVWYANEEWCAQWLDGARSAADATVLTVPGDGQILAHDVFIALGGVISGRLAVPPGWSDWCVVVATDAGTRLNLARDVCEGGATDFTFLGLPDGAVRVGFVRKTFWWGGLDAAPPDSTWWYPGTHDWDAATDLVISGADTVSGLVLPLP